jgi:hypothetical protein
MNIFYKKELNILTDYVHEIGISQIILQYIINSNINSKLLSIFKSRKYVNYNEKFNFGQNNKNELLKLQRVMYINNYSNYSSNLINMSFNCCELFFEYKKYFDVIINNSSKIIFCVTDPYYNELLLYSVDKNLGIFIEENNNNTVKTKYDLYMFNLDINNELNTGNNIMEGQIRKINSLDNPKYFKNKYAKIWTHTIFNDKHVLINQVSSKILSIMLMDIAKLLYN